MFPDAHPAVSLATEIMTSFSPGALQTLKQPQESSKPLNLTARNRRYYYFSVFCHLSLDTHTYILVETAFYPKGVGLIWGLLFPRQFVLLFPRQFVLGLLPRQYVQI